MPWKPFQSDTPFFIQGMTGKEGARMAKWLLASGANVVAGITPGKEGEQIEGRPIFNSVHAAREAFPSVTLSTIVVPSARVLGAVQEAIAAGMTYLNLLTEGVPVQDVLSMRRTAIASGATILGPSSVGYLQFPAFRTGYIGGENPWEQLTEGDTAVLSTSGGMVNEIMMGLARAGIGLRCAFAIGGDRISAYSLEEALQFCEQWSAVKRIILFVEPGRPFLPRLLRGTVSSTKPLILFLAGDILDILPRGKAYGHTGTLLGEEEETVHA